MAKKSTKAKAPGTPKASAAERVPVLDRVSLENVRFVDIRLNTKLTFGRRMTGAVEFAFKFGRPRVVVHGNEITARCPFSMDVRPDGGADGPPVAGVHAAIDTVFAWNADVSREISEQDQNELEGYACQTTWPYWREVVHSAFARMSLPPVTVPVIKRFQINDHLAKMKPIEIITVSVDTKLTDTLEIDSMGDKIESTPSMVGTPRS